MSSLQDMWVHYKLRWKRRRLLWRALRKRRQIEVMSDRTKTIKPDDILVFACLRNEDVRIPYWLDHYRRLGVGHFLIVDNQSDDESRALLIDQPDVSLWHTPESYRLSRFGVDWLTWLMVRHGHGHWCLTVDADELLIYPWWETRPLQALTEWLDQSDQQMMAAMMLELYPKGPLDEAPYAQGENPVDALPWFDAGNYWITRQEPMGQLWIQGGPRARKFFASEPRRAPTMSKIPLVRWNRRFAYVNSTHSILPRHLNQAYDSEGGEMLSGLLLHTKFLNTAVARAVQEKKRGEHFQNSELYDAYYDAVAKAPDLWCEASTRFRGWRHMEALGLLSRGNWL